MSRRKEGSFSLGQSLNEMVIPQYNALRDPFLSGFFQHQQIRTNLRRTGVITKKRVFSLQKYKEMVTDPRLIDSAEKHSSHKRTRSEVKGGSGQKLPAVEGKVDGRLWVKSEEYQRVKRVLRSVDGKAGEV